MYKISQSVADALAQMPNYVKCMKEIMSNKKKIEPYGTVNFSENCNANIQRKFPKILKDPGSFTIPCVIGEHTFSIHYVILVLESRDIHLEIYDFICNRRKK